MDINNTLLNLEYLSITGDPGGLYVRRRCFTWRCVPRGLLAQLIAQIFIPELLVMEYARWKYFIV